MRPDRAKVKFRQQLEAVELSQRSFARLLGVATVTVSRWCVGRSDGLAVPGYAAAFLACYSRLTAEQRREVRAERGLESPRAAA